MKHGVRKTMVEQMRKQFPDWNLDWVIGGQMGFDVFIKGWDKTFCLQVMGERELGVQGAKFVFLGFRSLFCKANGNPTGPACCG